MAVEAAELNCSKKAEVKYRRSCPYIFLLFLYVFEGGITMGPMMYVVCKYHEDAYDDFSERDILSSGVCFAKIEDATTECVRLCRAEASKYMPEPEIKTEKGKASFTAGTETYEFYVVGLPLKNPYTPQ